MYFMNFLGYGDVDEDGRLSMNEFVTVCSNWGLPVSGCRDLTYCALANETAVANDYIDHKGEYFEAGEPRLSCGAWDHVTKQHYWHYADSVMINQLFFADNDKTTCCGCGSAIKSKWCKNDNFNYMIRGKNWKTYPF